VQATPVAKLAKEDRQALFDLTKKCCRGVQSVLCQTILPKGLNQQPTDLCELGNFVCDPYGRLVKLSLGFAQFSCDLPTELAKFKQLRSLELDGSDFGGSSLDDLAKILKGTKTLERLFLRNTNMSGTIPCTLLEGKDLNSLYISYNHDIAGPLPACLLESKTLSELSVTATGVAGTIPDVIPEGSQLRVLTANAMDRAPRGYVPVHDLEQMMPGAMLVSERFSGPLPSSIKNAANLRLLALPNHNLTGELPQLPNSLLSLQLPFSRLTGTLPSKLPRSLVVLDLTNNSISGSLPDFSSASELGVVNLDVNQLEGTLPSSFGAAARSLVQLSLAANRLTGKVGDIKWEELTELATLALDGNNMGGTVPASLGGLKKLQFLSLSRTGLSGDLYAYADAIPTYPSSEQSFKQLNEDDTLNRGRKLLQGSTKEAPAAAAANEPVAAPATAAAADVPAPVAAPAPAKQAHSAAHTAAAQTPVAAAAAPAIEAVAAPAHTAGAAHTAPAKAPAPIGSDAPAAGAGAAVAAGATAAAPVATTAAAAAPAAAAATVATTAPAAVAATAAPVATKAAAPAAMDAAATDTTAVTSTAAEATTPAAAPAATKSAATTSTVTAEPVAAPAAAPTKANAAAAGGGALAAAAVATDPSAVEPPAAGPGQGRTFPSLPEDQVNSSMAVGHMPGPSAVQGALPVDNSMRAGDTAAQADYWRPDDLDMTPPPERPNSLLHVDFSNNHLTGTVPPAIYKMNMFADLAISKDPMSRRVFRRSLDLSDNKLQGVYPTELLMVMPMLEYNCPSPDCTGMVDLSGNQLYCPQNSSIQAVKASLEAEKLEWNQAAAAFEHEDCLVAGSADRYKLSEYLTNPNEWVETVPTFSSARSSGSSSGPSAAVIAGTVIGVVAAAAIIGGLIFWGVKKARNRPLSYRKNDVPDYAVNVVGPQGTAAGVV